MRKIAVIGAGYVGMATALTLARKNHVHVTLFESDRDKMRSLSEGKSPINEDRMNSTLKNKLGTSLFLDSGGYDECMSEFEAIFICVGTPTKSNGKLEDKFILKVLDQLADSYYEGAIIIKSTVNYGDTERFSEMHKGLNLVFSPEFLREGTALADSMNPHRLVFGLSSNSIDSTYIKDLMYYIYKHVIRRSTNDCKVLFMTASSAELAKLGANSFLATKLTFFNELSNLCSASNRSTDIKDVRDAMCLDPRIGDQYSNPSIGYAGPCLPKDTESLAKVAKSLGARMRVLEGTIKANDSMLPNYINWLNKIIKVNKVKSILFLGVSFKSYSDDLRSSRSLEIYETIKSKNKIVHAYDPRAGIPSIELRDNYDLVVVSSAEYLDKLKLFPDSIVVDLKDVGAKGAAYYGGGYRV